MTPADRGRPIPRWLAERSLPGRRLFVAVPLPPDSRAAVERLVGDVRETVLRSIEARAAATGGDGPPREVRWVRLDGLHLTLRFLGPTLDERMAAIEDAMRAASAAGEPFQVEIAGGGAFPTPSRPRVLWLGVTAGAGELGALARRLADGLAGAGWAPEDRPFRPHLTLARSDGIAAGPATAGALIAAAEAFATSWTADRLVLFESHTGGGPARYEAHREVRLGA